MTLFEINSDNLNSIISYIGIVFDSVKPLFFLIMGIVLGLWILGSIIERFKQTKEK